MEGTNFCTATGEIVLTGPYLCVEERGEWERDQPRSAWSESQHLSASHCPLWVSAHRRVELLSCRPRSLVPKGFHPLRRRSNAWIQQELRKSQDCGCTDAYKETVFTTSARSRGVRRKMCCRWRRSIRRHWRGSPVGWELARVEGSDVSDSGSLQDTGIRNEAADGEELLVTRVPRTPELNARHITAHEFIGHVVYRSWCRHCVA